MAQHIPDDVVLDPTTMRVTMRLPTWSSLNGFSVKTS